VCAEPVLDFIYKMSQDPQSKIEEHVRTGNLVVGTNLHFSLTNVDHNATVRFEGLVQSVGADNPPTFEIWRRIRAVGSNAIALTLANDIHRWHVTFHVDDDHGENIVSVDTGGDDHYYRDRLHHWFFEFQGIDGSA
jgi:hypothetical protein